MLDRNELSPDQHATRNASSPYSVRMNDLCEYLEAKRDHLAAQRETLERHCASLAEQLEEATRDCAKVENELATVRRELANVDEPGAFDRGEDSGR